MRFHLQQQVDHFPIAVGTRHVQGVGDKGVAYTKGGGGVLLYPEGALRGQCHLTPI